MKAEKRHEQWLDELQSEGWVFSAMVLAEKQLNLTLDRRSWLQWQGDVSQQGWQDIGELVHLLGWQGVARQPAADEVLQLFDLDVEIRPDRVLEKSPEEPKVYVFWQDDDFDSMPTDSKWLASHQTRFERFLKSHFPHVGLHICPDALRLTYAPPNQAVGLLTFPLDALQGENGALLFAVVQALFSGQTLWAEEGKDLLSLLTASRENQDKVTEELALQVLQALRILIEGVDAANKRSEGAFLEEVEPKELYESLTVVLLRMIFLLYAEDCNLIPTENAIYNGSYSISGLAEKLEQDAVLYADSMDQRFGGWARFAALCRMVYEGVSHQLLTMPERKGGLFDPDSYPFLEGRRDSQQRARLPQIDDACVHAVLRKIRYLRGQRLSFQNLEVEQIGSVYESLMGYSIEQADEPCLTLLPDGVVVSLEKLRTAANPYKWLCTQLEEKKLPKSVDELKKFAPSEQIITDYDRLEKHLSARLVGKRIPKGHHYLQSAPGRRWSGSHYTPKVLSGPIVEKTLSPLLGENPTEEQILALKICDPAMGSGAFLAMACRYLGERLVESWSRAGKVNEADNAIDLANKARRMVAERCLYGVDRNPRAVQLARLSLWIVTASKNDSFAFLDHALKEGDAIVGCTPEQIAAFQMQFKKQPDVAEMYKQMEIAKKTRSSILSDQLSLTFGGNGYDQKSIHLRSANQQVYPYRVRGDVLIASILAGGGGAVKKRIKEMAALLQDWQLSEPLPEVAQELLDSLPFQPFHWHLEFPEVFLRGRSSKKDFHGFDAIVGNPPFAGKNTIIAGSGDEYIKALNQHWPHAHGKSDLCAYFFLRAAEVLRRNGCLGLIATNTIDQGVTRQTGLQHIVKHKAIELYNASVDMTWPVAGASVIVTTLHAFKGKWGRRPRQINGKDVKLINSELDELPEIPDPQVQSQNNGKSYQGSNILGMGFTLTFSACKNLLELSEKNQKCIQPCIGGQELNADPNYSFNRYVINFGEMSLEEAGQWPLLLDIVKEKVKPARSQSKRKLYREKWWHFGEKQIGLYNAIKPLKRCLVCSSVSKYSLFAFQPTNRVFTHALIAFALDQYSDFCILQSRIHEWWARKMGSTLGLGLRYTPSSCFKTFPFPRPNAEQAALLNSTGKALYEKRSAIMLANDIGMTETWNRLMEDKNPHHNDEEIVELRQLRYAMDKAVLAAYGWDDLEPTDAKNIIARLRQLNAERVQEESEQGEGA